jgi:ribosomal-protein-alanine N-acetyltransferase
MDRRGGALSGPSRGELAARRPTVLDTPRLVLREFTPRDVDDLHRCDGDARVMRWLGAGLPARTRDQVAEAIARMQTNYARRPGYGLLHASRRDDGRFVGACGVSTVPEGDDVEIAYRLPVDCWGQGYATEMARAVLGHAHGTLRLPRVIGLTWPENGASSRVLEKIGMQYRGRALHYGREMQLYVSEVAL